MTLPSATATKHTHRTNAGDGTRAEALDLAAEINALHGEIAAMARTTLGKTIEIGELLTKQKAALKHGEWLPWCGAIMDSKPNSGPTGFPEDPAGGDEDNAECAAVDHWRRYIDPTL